MVETAKQLKSDTIVKCNNFEVVQGNIDNALWIMKIENKLKVVLDTNEYKEIMEMAKKLMKENFELKLEKTILSEFPIDYDDVKAVVLEEMKKNNQQNIEQTVNKIKIEHPNLFYNLNVDKIF